MAQYESFCKNLSITQLGEEQKELCEGMVTDDEASCALSCMKNGSAPGAFYKLFCSKIRDMVINPYNESFDEGKLSRSYISNKHWLQNFSKNFGSETTKSDPQSSFWRPGWIHTGTKHINND